MAATPPPPPTLVIKDPYEQARKPNSEARRNPNANSGTSAIQIMLATRIDPDHFTCGSGEFIKQAGLCLIHGEERAMGIEDVIETNPDITIIDNNTGAVIRLKTDHHAEAPYVDAPNKSGAKKAQEVLRRTKGHGYRRNKMKIQRITNRVNWKVVVVMFIESVFSILKPSPAKMGALLNSTYRKIRRLNARVNSMEKTQGSRLIKAYIARNPKGSELCDGLYTIATEKPLVGPKRGDCAVALLVESYSDIGEYEEMLARQERGDA